MGVLLLTKVTELYCLDDSRKELKVFCLLAAVVFWAWFFTFPVWVILQHHIYLFMYLFLNACLCRTFS